MIRIEVKRTDNNDLVGFHVEGHAEFADYGNDIICAGVSALTTNCINSIEKLTQDKFDLKTDEELGLIDFTVKKPFTDETNLLMLSLLLGLKGISKDYGEDYVKLIDIEEV